MTPWKIVDKAMWIVVLLFVGFVIGHKEGVDKGIEVGYGAGYQEAYIETAQAYTKTLQQCREDNKQIHQELIREYQRQAEQDKKEFDDYIREQEQLQIKLDEQLQARWKAQDERWGVIKEW